MSDPIPTRPHVRVDPAQRFGRPNVKGVSCDIIAEAVLAERDVTAVAGEYGLTRPDVLVACWYVGTYDRDWIIWEPWARAAHEHLWRSDYDKVADPPLRRVRRKKAAGKDVPSGLSRESNPDSAERPTR